jgi:cell division cycle protein 20 (cofactor of APC complex)
VFRSHQAAVKAIDWCPWQSNFLATGGGQKDKSINVWNVYTGSQLKHIETNSQVTGLLWSSNTKEIVSSHGHPSNNLMIWKYPTMTKVGEFEGHTDRILSISMCPRGEIVASSSADQSIRFWEYFKTSKENLITGTPLSTHSLSRQLHNIR